MRHEKPHCAFPALSVDAASAEWLFAGQRVIEVLQKEEQHDKIPRDYLMSTVIVKTAKR